MSGGFYKRRRGILEHLEAGTISLLDLAVHDYLNLKANLVIGGNGSSLPPGVCITSAVAIHATCPSQISERAIQRSLEHLERIGWIKRWNVRGKRGNYPVLVCRASVHDLSGNEHRVDGTKTTDWRAPALVPVGDVSAVREVADAKLSGDREVRIEKENKPPVALPREAGELTALLKAKILGNNPTTRITERQLAKWAREADLMMRIDGRPEADIRTNIEWSQQNDFWKTNILSMANLRKHFDKLTAKRQQEQPTRASSTVGPIVAQIPTAADCRPTH